MFAKSSASAAPSSTSSSSSTFTLNTASSQVANTAPLEALLKKLNVLTGGGISKAGFDTDPGVTAVTLHKALTGLDVSLDSLSDVGATFEVGAKQLIEELRHSTNDVSVFLDIGRNDPMGHRFLIIRLSGAYFILHSSGYGKFSANQWINGLKSHGSFTSPYAKILDHNDIGIILTMLTEKNLTSICKMLFNNGNVSKFLTTAPLRYRTDAINLKFFNDLKSLNSL